VKHEFCSRCHHGHPETHFIEGTCIWCIIHEKNGDASIRTKAFSMYESLYAAGLVSLSSVEIDTVERWVRSAAYGGMDPNRLAKMFEESLGEHGGSLVMWAWYSLSTGHTDVEHVALRSVANRILYDTGLLCCRARNMRRSTNDESGANGRKMSAAVASGDSSEWSGEHTMKSVSEEMTSLGRRIEELESRQRGVMCANEALKSDNAALRAEVEKVRREKEALEARNRSLGVASAALDSICDAVECPLSLSTMADPVVARGGQAFDRGSLDEWFKQCAAAGRATTNPSTGEPLQASEVSGRVPALKKICEAVEEYRSKVQ
jgi:hypothetical protein